MWRIFLISALTFPYGGYCILFLQCFGLLWFAGEKALAKF